jgi:hypothetical protein
VKQHLPPPGGLHNMSGAANTRVVPASVRDLLTAG